MIRKKLKLKVNRMVLKYYRILVCIYLFVLLSCLLIYFLLVLVFLTISIPEDEIEGRIRRYDEFEFQVKFTFIGDFKLANHLKKKKINK